MGSDEEDRAWALCRLLDFAEHLTAQGVEIASLRSAGVNDRRVANLYPFSFSEFASGIYFLTNASWSITGGFEPVTEDQQRTHAISLLTSNYEVLVNPSRFFIEEGTRLKQAVHSINGLDETKGIAPFLLEIALSTLDELANRGILNLTLINPLTGQVMPLIKQRAWKSVLADFAAVVDELCQILKREPAAAT